MLFFGTITAKKYPPEAAVRRALGALNVSHFITFVTINLQAELALFRRR